MGPYDYNFPSRTSLILEAQSMSEGMDNPQVPALSPASPGTHCSRSGVCPFLPCPHHPISEQQVPRLG